MDYIFTSESVSEGHPDKIADQISDGILDAIIAKDPDARVACETLVKTGVVILAGEITSKTYVDFSQVTRKIITDIGYDNSELGFDGNSCGVISIIDEQSPDIAIGVTSGQGLHQEQGAGDQGMMFGYACQETPAYMPASIHYAHLILQRLAKIRRNKEVNFLRPDAKGQVTAEYRDGVLNRIDTIVVSSQHAPGVPHSQLKEFIIEECIKKSIPEKLLVNTKYYINPTGQFIIGGPKGDCGLTGRKIIVDTYGGHGAHGGGAFSGKDPSKVDRSASYMARYIAKHIVAAKLATKCLVQLAYAIGVAEPISIHADTYGTGMLPEAELVRMIHTLFPLKPEALIAHLDLKRPIYRPSCIYGHFGHEHLPWEQLSMLEQVKSFHNF